MTDTELEVLRFVQENDVKFIRLAFSDMFGIQKNISVMPDELPGPLKPEFPLTLPRSGDFSTWNSPICSSPRIPPRCPFYPGGPPTAGWCGCSAM